MSAGTQSQHESERCPRCGKVGYSFLHSCPLAGLSVEDAQFVGIVTADRQSRDSQ